MLESGERYTVQDVIGNQAIVTSHAEPDRAFLLPVTELPSNAIGDGTFFYNGPPGTSAAHSEAFRYLNACVMMLLQRGVSREELRAMLRALSVDELNDADRR